MEKEELENLLRTNDPNGYVENFYYNGPIKSKGTYFNYKFVGLWIWYNYDGTIRSKGCFDLNSNRIGYWLDNTFYFTTLRINKTYYII